MSDIKRYEVEMQCIDWDRYELKEVEDKTGDYVKHSDHLAAIEAAKKEAVVEWLKSIKAECRITCDPSCKFSSLCYMRAEYWDNEAIQKAAEV